MIQSMRYCFPQFLCAALLAAATVPAGDTLLELDPAQTKVEFTLSTTLHTVHGTFVLKRGNISFDAATGRASGELVVDAASGDSDSGARDRRMHKAVLESDRYAEFVFRPDRIQGPGGVPAKVAHQGASHVELHGVFAVHGAEHEFTLPLDVDAANGQCAVTTHFSIPYVQWGLKNPSTFVLRVSDKVEVTIHTVARPVHAS